LSYIWLNDATSALQWVNLAGNYTLQVFNLCDTIEYVYILQYRDIFKPEAIQDTNLCETSDLEFDLNYPRVEDVKVNGRVLFGNLLTESKAGSYVIEYE
jgi:hypothetical protein